MSHPPVLIKRNGAWREAGEAVPHSRADGWNLKFPGGLPGHVTSLLVMTAGTYAPNTKLRVLVTRPRRDGGTDWYDVGEAWVSKHGKALVITITTQLPAGEAKLVILPYRTRATA
ncbi:hypothetical protein [Deinococcus radiotolerans]|uniref:Phage tail protein n=1 Tax=Deinococcus radiotolerans TaxID=1309407 RepID=A0ABQ2FNF3_9DEIO|nr:hypothetical protein [Deinococcus radiotolerans]GGL11204.1 hypothetical protein GCM10010844_32320 [Deinococcus radiotolerans]